MTVLSGTLSLSPKGGMSLPVLSSALGDFAVDYWPPHVTTPSANLSAVVAPQFPVAAHPRSLAGAIAHGYLDDFYNRIHINPAVLNLGNLVTDQTRTIEVWNAFPATAHTLTAVDEINTGGITLTAPSGLPLSFNPLQSRLWTVSVQTIGPPMIDATLSWDFTGLDPAPLRILGSRLTAWTQPADWGSPITESLIWLTDVQESLDGSEYREPLRDTPRRQWEFDIVAEGRDRQQMEATLYDWTSRYWAYPVWPDITVLSMGLAQGATSVPAATAGRDFNPGSLVMLWSNPQTYELVEVDSITDTAVLLAHPTANAWPAGARLYPCRTARLTDTPKLSRKSDRLTTTSVRFEATEPCLWPAIAPAATYLGLPVLEDRPDESNDLDAAYDRQLVDIDSDVGLVYVDDITGLAFPTQSHAWVLAGVAARASLRSLLYWLQGSAAALWVPSWSDDLTLAAPVAVSDPTLTVANIGVTSHLQQQPGRRHLRIELFDGTIYYRRVTTSAVIDATTEQLAIDSALGVAIDASAVRQINWLMLCRQAGDTVQIAHETDSEGVATASTSFAGVPGEEP